MPKKKLLEQPTEQLLNSPPQPTEQSPEQPTEQTEKTTSDKKQEVIRLYNEGKSLSQIAALTKIPKGWVSRILSDYGVKELDPLAIRDEFLKLRGDLSTYKAQHNERFDALEHKVESLVNKVDSFISAFSAFNTTQQNPETVVYHPQSSQTSIPTQSSQTPPPTQPDEPPFLKAFSMLEQGLGPIDLMRNLNMDVESIKNILADWKALRDAYDGTTPRDVVLPHVAKVMGESLRDTCDHFNPQSGVCMAWHVTEVDDAFRKAAPGIVKGVGGKLRWNVSSHPEVCALCTLGRKVKA